MSNGMSETGVEDVPMESYTPDGLVEEERIMAERGERPKTLDSDALRAPLAALNLPPPKTVGLDACICDALEIMQKDNYGCVLVVEPSGSLAGIFTERDILLKLAGKGLNWREEKVATFMTPNPETLPESANLAFALNVMSLGGFRHVPILDGSRCPKAVVSMKDVVRYLTSFFEEEVQNLPPRPNLLHPRQRESG